VLHEIVCSIFLNAPVGSPVDGSCTITPFTGSGGLGDPCKLQSFTVGPTNCARRMQSDKRAVRDDFIKKLFYPATQQRRKSDKTSLFPRSMGYQDVRRRIASLILNIGDGLGVFEMYPDQT
jgi:hypothetical protein